MNLVTDPTLQRIIGRDKTSRADLPGSDQTYSGRNDTLTDEFIRHREMADTLARTVFQDDNMTSYGVCRQLHPPDDPYFTIKLVPETPTRTTIAEASCDAQHLRIYYVGRLQREPSALENLAQLTSLAVALLLDVCDDADNPSSTDSSWPIFCPDPSIFPQSGVDLPNVIEVPASSFNWRKFDIASAVAIAQNMKIGSISSAPKIKLKFHIVAADGQPSGKIGRGDIAGADGRPSGKSGRGNSANFARSVSTCTNSEGRVLKQDIENTPTPLDVLVSRLCPHSFSRPFNGHDIQKLAEVCTEIAHQSGHICIIMNNVMERFSYMRFNGVFDPIHCEKSAPATTITQIQHYDQLAGIHRTRTLLPIAILAPAEFVLFYDIYSREIGILAFLRPDDFDWTDCEYYDDRMLKAAPFLNQQTIMSVGILEPPKMSDEPYVVSLQSSEPWSFLTGLDRIHSLRGQVDSLGQQQGSYGLRCTKRAAHRVWSSMVKSVNLIVLKVASL